MDTLKFDLSQKAGSFKRMNAVNNGPCHKRHTNRQLKSNFETYKEARIPYARNHDAAFNSGYGGEHTVDISAIFPDFNADPYAPESYDFAMTDEYTMITHEAGTKIFYRLGQKIENGIKKYATLPPADFKKWAVICEHIIRHYNEGWANGFQLGLEYWEIWNEPDLDPDDSTNKRTWGGTTAQFFDFYEIAAKHLKSCFPHLKIGGPAIAHRMEWAEMFLHEMKRREVPIDFFSWHIYCTEPSHMIERSEIVRRLLVESGYDKAESILNEWNYVKGWSEEFVYSIESIISIKGAAFNMACMTAAQHSTIDMLMYYDARPTAFNGIFDFYTLRPLKGYYPFLWYGMFYDMEAEVLCNKEIADIYTLCGVDKAGESLAVITYYTDDDNAPAKTLSVDFGREAEYEIYLLDKDHDGQLVTVTEDLTLTLQANTCVMIKSR